MSWWCSSSRARWVWSYHPYVGAWLIVGAVVAIALWWHRSGRLDDPMALGHGPDGQPFHPVPGSDTGRKIALVVGIVGLWACTDWPLAALGAGYLATAQMVRQMTMVMIVAPSLLFACPPGLAIRLVGWRRRFTVLRITARPFIAVAFAAGSLVLVNTPIVVDTLVKTPYAMFFMDGMWVAAGFILWMPVQCPHPGVKRLVGAEAMTYLIAQSIVPVLPGFFMTWADFPIYRTYELAPRVFAGFDAVTDQGAAAAVLQVGGMLLLWIQIAYRFLHWSYAEVTKDQSDVRKRMTGLQPGTP